MAEREGDRRRDFAVAAKRAILFVVIWLTLTAADPEGFMIGAAATAAATWLSLRLLPPGPRRVSTIAALRMAPSFLWRSLLGGIDVGLRAVSPRMPLAPGWKEVPTRLPPGPARAVVGGQFSLLPGTLVAGARGDRLLVHLLDEQQDVVREVAVAEAALGAVIGMQGQKG